MRVKLFTLRYSPTLGGFDETPLAEFTRDKELLGFREHFFALNEVPHLVCVLTWQDAVVSDEDLRAARELQARPEPNCNPRPISTGEAPNRHRERSRNGPDPTAGLDERQRALFNTLREWRSKKAHDEGVPPYLVFTNRHLVAIVQRLPDSPTALGNLHGIGPGKVKRYGQEVLALLAPTVRGHRRHHGGRPVSPYLSDRPPAREAGPELLVLQRWEEFTGWLLAHTSRWPKSARFTLCQRVQNHALDVTELLVVARFEPRVRRRSLRRANLLLERMRHLFRLARGANVMPKAGFESAMRGVDETGRMLGGWRKTLEVRTNMAGGTP